MKAGTALIAGYDTWSLPNIVEPIGMRASSGPLAADWICDNEIRSVSVPRIHSYRGSHDSEVTKMTRAFKVICSDAALAELADDERMDIVQRAIPEAMERDRGVHEGLAFSFGMRGKEWAVVVDVGAYWVKILRKDELEKSVREAVQAN